jgi:hypothetical protein
MLKFTMFDSYSELSHDSEGESLKGCEKFIPEVLVLSEWLEGNGIESHRRVVLEVRILSEQLEGEDIPNFLRISEMLM